MGLPRPQANLDIPAQKRHRRNISKIDRCQTGRSIWGEVKNNIMTRTPLEKCGSARSATKNKAPSVFVPSLCFLLGLGLGAFWFYPRKSGHPPENQTIRISGQTRSVLRHLGAPVEIRLFSLLPAPTAPESLQAYSRRVAALLNLIGKESAGLVKTSVLGQPTHAAAAAAEGLTAFNLEKGEPCFLGMTLVCADRKESFPRLQPAWESALESDLARALERLSAQRTIPLPGPALDPDEVASGTLAIGRLIPNFKEIPFDECVRALREAAGRDLAEAGAEMEKQISKAQRALQNAQEADSQAGQLEARSRLQKTQLEQADKLKQITARLQSRITVLRQLKSPAPAQLPN